MKDFKFDYCDIVIGSELTMSGGVSMKIIEKADSEGNILAPADMPTFCHELDNHQAYELAMEILKRIDVNDTRGSK